MLIFVKKTEETFKNTTIVVLRVLGKKNSALRAIKVNLWFLRMKVYMTAVKADR